MQENNTISDNVATTGNTQMTGKPQKAAKAPKQPKAAKAAKAPKQPKAAKAAKVPKAAKEHKEDKPVKQGGFMLFSIRNKIILCFLVPILFMVVIGVSAYQTSAQGMSDKFLESSMQTIEMATEYVEMSCTFISTEAVRYAFDDDLNRYYLGMYAADPVGQSNLLSSTRTNMAAAKVANPFISNVHIITKKGVGMLSTKSGSSIEGFLEEYLASVTEDGKTLDTWIDSHEALDAHLEMITNDDRYILVYQTLAKSNNASIVVDVKESAIQEFLQELDFGEGSIVGFVTKGGREIICETLPEGAESNLPEGEKVFFGQEYFDKISAQEELTGNDKVTYLGEEYLFLYSVGEKTGATICALVPTDIVIGQAEDIRSMTVTLVILASVTVVIIGMLIVIGIQNNMKRISKKFGEVAKGDLTVQVTAKGRDEFRGLAGSATNMITNTKKLVDKVNAATGQLEMSSKEVEQASGVIHSYSQDITQAIAEINEGIGRQARHAQECVDKTDVLSNEIQNVSAIVEKVKHLVEETDVMINQGMEIIRLLGSRAKETTQMTVKVGESIESLRQESEVINSFVGTITDISEQTNLLSLNASIEAARAGEAGRGFAVVAEEIRKLADDSARAAGEIRNNVEHISAQTMNSVQSANEAGDMVALQSQAVEQVVDVFQQMRGRMGDLVGGLQEIVTGTERADMERSAAVAAVKSISDIIEETATSAETVNEVAGKLLENVENLDQTAEALGENMKGLKGEISVFKI